MIVKEACIGSVEAGVEAAIRGADRLEVCEHLEIGGTTPSEAYLKAVIESVKIPCVAIIRPRGGNFVYDEKEFEQMLVEIERCCKMGVYGIAIGILTPDGEVDVARMRQVMDVSCGLSVTFHMAFDETRDMKKALEELIALNVHRILTKGGALNAPNGVRVLSELVGLSQNRIIIMPGGGVTKDNYQEIVRITNATEVHGTKIV